MIPRTTLAGLILAAGLVSNLAVSAQEGPLSGGQLYEKCTAEEKGGEYPIDGYCWTTINDAMGKIIISNENEPTICIPGEETWPQLVAMVTNFLAKNPNKRDRPALDLIKEAALEAFPCK